MSEPHLITTENNIDDDKEPESSSRMISSPKDIDESQKINEAKREKKLHKKDLEDYKFVIEDEYLSLDECTAMTLGPEAIYQKCFICPFCNPKKDHYFCKFCFYKCHQKCRTIAQAEPKQEDFKGEKHFACYCGYKLKHRPELPQRQEQKMCDLIILDKSLKIGLLFCETHQISICGVCSVECHKRCNVRKYKDNNPGNEHQCMCINENHTSYNELALTFTLDEYQKLGGVAVWPIQILNILFNQKRFEKLSNLFKSMLNKEEISEEKRKKFFPLLELFSNTFNRKFKTLYYEEDIINTFNYDNLLDYIKNIEIDNSDMILLKFRLVSILLFVHLKNDFQITKCLTSIDFVCNNLLERIEYKKILSKKNIFNKTINEKYNLNTLYNKEHKLKNVIINDLCNLMSEGMDLLNIEENEEIFEIGLKFICFMMKKMFFTKEELINLINSLYIFFEKFFTHFNSKKSNLFLLIDLISGLSELFLMISVNYNDMVVMDYLDKYESTTNINKIELNDDFIHVSSEHGNKLFEMIMKCCKLLRNHYELLNRNEEKNKLKEKRIFKDKIKMLILSKTSSTVEIKLPEDGGLFFGKVVREFTESLGIFSLADNIYFKQIDSITKDDLISYYDFCNRIQNNTFDNLSKKDVKKFNEIIHKVKLEIESKFKVLFSSSYSNIRDTIDNDLNNLLLELSSQLNEIFNKIENKNDIDVDEEEKITKNIKKGKKVYLTVDKRDENDEEAEEKEAKIDKINYFLTKIAVKNKSLYPFLIKNSFCKVCKDFVDNLIISNLDETITKILVFFSNRKYPNILSYNLLDIIFSTLCLYFFSKRGIKYLLTGKILVRINKVFNRYDHKSKQKNVNPAFGKTLEQNIKFITRIFDFCLDLFKGKKLYELSLKNHKVLQRFQKNMLGHICLFNIESKQQNMEDFLIQFKKTMKIFYFLSDDLEFEDLNQIKKQCIFILKQNPYDLFEKKSFFSTFNNEINIDDNVNKDKLALKENLKKGKKNNVNDIINNNEPKDKNEMILSLYFTFFKLYGINTYYMYETKENNVIMNILDNFNDLNLIRQNLANNNFNLKQKIILLKYLRSVYFIDHLNEYNILLQKSFLTTMDYNALIKCNAIIEEKYEKCLNLKEGLSLPANIVKELMNKYNMISKLEIIVNIYLNEMRIFPRQLLNNKMELCKIFYKELLLDIKFISNFFYALKNAWSRFNILFYQLCLEFLPKIDIFRNVFLNLKGTNNTLFDIGEELYVIPLDKDEEDEIEHNPKLKKKLREGKLNKNLNQDEQWDLVKLEAYKAIQKLKSISFDIYNTKEIYSILNEYIEHILKISNLGQLYDLESYLAFFDETAEANFTPFSLLETLDYEYFYEENKQEKDELIKKDFNLFKLKNLKDSFFESFIDIHNTNFINIITKIESDSVMYDYSKEYVELFKSFINSKEGNRFHLLNILLCILTKMLFYNSEGIQDKFEEFINDEDFFPNMNRLLNIYLVLVFSLSKNIYAYNFVSEINNVAKLLLQLLQSLGEGFNTKYHNNIFKFQKEVPLLNEEDEESDDNEDENSSGLESQKNLIYENEKKDDDEENNEKLLDNINNLKGNKIYKSKLKIEIPNINVTNTIYDSIITNLKYALTSLDMKSLIEGEMPYDKLIISVTNIFDFLIEYIESEGDNNEKIKNSFRNLLFGIKKKKNEFDKTNIDLLNEEKCINVLFLKLEPEENDKKLYLLRKKIICFIKYKFANLLIYYLLTGGKDNMVEKLIKNNCSPIDLFSELVYNFKELLNHLKLKNPDLVKKLESAKKSSKTSDFVDTLIDFYGYEEDFRNMIEFPVIINFYILIKIFEEFYNHKELKSHFETIKDTFNTFNSVDSDDIEDYSIRSKFSYCIYLFLEEIIIKIEIKMEKEEEEDENEGQIEENKKKIAKLVMKNIRNDPFIHKMKTVNKKLKNSKIKESYDEDEEIESEESESDDENAKNGIKTAFFLRPYLTFTLSESSKEKFIKNVDRSNASQKFVSLVNFADYCLFEMVANRHLIGNSKFKNYLANINYFIIEVISYLVIIVNNIFVIFHFYKSTDLPLEEYDIFDEEEKSVFYADNILISVIQAAILLLFVIIWFFFEFINHFQYSVMKLYNKKFVLKKSGEENKISQTIIDYFQDKEDTSSFMFFSEVIKNVSGWERLYVILFEACLFNREINMFLFTIIFNILFLTIGSYLFIVFEILFIINIVPTLFDIFQAMRLKYLHIILVLLFDFLLVYIFMWIGFFFFQDFFVYDDILESSSGSRISESYCYSSVQCFLYYISLGTRNGGGIGDAINQVSYQKDVYIFIGRFINDLLFFFLINLIMANVFLGIIIDTFGELRDTQSEYENDRNNICFICQLSSDACLTRNIDFDNHVNTIHNIWNYVYFLAYLHLNNQNNFNRVENSVWEKLEIQDYSWIPIDKSSDD